MFVKFLGLFCLLGLTCGGRIPPKYPIQQVPKYVSAKIIGGEEVAIEDVPYQVAVLVYGTHICSGIIVRSNAVITAASCIGGDPSIFSIRAGSSSHVSGGQIVGMKSFERNEFYNWRTLDFNIGFVNLVDEIILGETARVVALAEQGDVINSGEIGQVSGWGFMNDQESSSSLFRATVTVTDQSSCATAYGEISWEITPRMFCAGSTESSAGFCDGDWGGSLIIDGKLYGINSHVYGCGLSQFPGVFTSITVFRLWIDGKLALN